VDTLLEVDKTLLIQPGQIGLDPEPSTHRQSEGGEEDRTTMLRVMDFGELGSAELTVEASPVVRHPKHEAQNRR